MKEQVKVSQYCKFGDLVLKTVTLAQKSFLKNRNFNRIHVYIYIYIYIYLNFSFDGLRCPFSLDPMQIIIHSLIVFQGIFHF